MAAHTWGVASKATVGPPIFKPYRPVPEHLELQQVVVLHRHGDRAQLSRGLGDKYPESGEITSMWTGLLPTEATLKAMAAASRVELPSSVSHSSASLKEELQAALYTGWDIGNIPYSQLTELGAQQMIGLGKLYRSRYSDRIIPRTQAALSEKLYCRSTNMCRTLQSLRSFLAGILEINGETTKVKYSDPDAPTIVINDRMNETMFPQADGPCAAMAQRRNKIFPSTLPYDCISGYAEIEQKMKSVLGFEDKVNWMTTKEVLTCHASHSIERIEGVTQEDLDKISEIAAWTWGVNYKDDVMNKLAIGRFLTELLEVIERNLLEIGSGAVVTAAEEGEGMGCGSNRKSLIIFSGHDSTVVPVMCALGIYDDTWPPYASHLVFEIADSKHSGERMVRVLFNDEDRAIVGSGGKEWCPLSVLTARLRSLALTRAECRNLCAAALLEQQQQQHGQQDLEQQQQQQQQDERQLAAEIAATIGAEPSTLNEAASQVPGADRSSKI